MGIIIKFILRNTRDKKLRTFLIVFAIAVSAALFFASNALSGTMEKMYLDRVKQYYGSAELMITASEKSPSVFFDTAGTAAFKDRCDYIIGVVQGSGLYKPNRDEKVNVTLLGIDYNDVQKMNPIILAKDAGMDSFEGGMVIISRNTAEKYGFSAGGNMEVEIKGERRKLYIAGIAEPEGLFVEDGRTTYAVVPREYLASVYSNRGKVTTIFMKVSSSEELTSLKNVLADNYKRYSVREPISKSDLKRRAGQVSMPFMIMTLVVLSMSIFIIYTAFKVITMERLPVIGTFRSIGATRLMTDIVLIVESILYGVIGGFFGCSIGIGVLYIIAKMSVKPWEQGVKTTIFFTPMQLTGAFLIAILLSLISSLVPIYQVSKIPVKDIVLNGLEKRNGGKKSWKPIAGAILLVLAFVVPPMMPDLIKLPITIICMLMPIAAVILLIPFFTSIFVKVFENIYLFIFGNVGILAAKNLRENKSLLNNISLLAIGLSCLLTINTVSFSVIGELTSFYAKTANFEIMLYPREEHHADKSFEQLIQTIDGVTGTYGMYEARSVEVGDGKERISTLNGIDKDKFLDYWKIELPGNPEVMLNELESSRNIMITNALKEKFKVNLGDQLTLKMKNGKKDYKIIGFFNTLMSGGEYAIIAERFYKVDMSAKYYNEVYVKTSKDYKQVADDIKKKFGKKQLGMNTMSEMAKQDEESNSQMFTILRGFSMMALVIGIVGVINNLIISFIERKRYLAMFRSVGMSKFQIIRMMLIESLTGGIIGGIIGIITGVILIEFIPHILIAINEPRIPMHYSFGLLLYSLLAGVVIMLIASISPAIKSSKLNIIESIKYE